MVGEAAASGETGDNHRNPVTARGAGGIVPKNGLSIYIGCDAIPRALYIDARFISGCLSAATARTISDDHGKRVGALTDYEEFVVKGIDDRRARRMLSDIEACAGAEPAGDADPRFIRAVRQHIKRRT